MTEQDRDLAAAVLRYLCVGAYVGGLRFGATPELLIDGSPAEGQVYLNLESAWQIFPGPPATIPQEENQVPVMTEEQALLALCALRESEIVDIALGGDCPHLLVHFIDGRVLFVLGRHARFECWQLCVSWGPPDERSLVVARPGCEVAVWSPPGFRPAGVKG